MSNLPTDTKACPTVVLAMVPVVVNEPVAVVVKVLKVDQVVLEEVDLIVNLEELEHLDKVIMVVDLLVALVAVAVEEKVV